MSIEYTDKNVPFINLGDGYQIRLEYESALEEKYVEKARNELRETPEVVENAIAEFREMVKSEFQFLFLKMPSGDDDNSDAVRGRQIVQNY